MYMYNEDVYFHARLSFMVIHVQRVCCVPVCTLKIDKVQIVLCRRSWRAVYDRLKSKPGNNKYFAKLNLLRHGGLLMLLQCYITMTQQPTAYLIDPL